VGLAKGDLPEAPAEAITLARYDLMQIGGRIDGAMSRVTDAESKAHLAESKAIIQGALEAAFLRG